MVLLAELFLFPSSFLAARAFFNIRLRNPAGEDNTGTDIAEDKFQFAVGFCVSAGDMNFSSCRAGIDWKIKTNVWSGMSAIFLLYVGFWIF